MDKPGGKNTDSHITHITHTLNSHTTGSEGSDTHSQDGTQSRREPHGGTERRTTHRNGKTGKITTISELDGDLEDREKHNPGNPPKQLMTQTALSARRGKPGRKHMPPHHPQLPQP